MKSFLKKKTATTTHKNPATPKTNPQPPIGGFPQKNPGGKRFLLQAFQVGRHLGLRPFERVVCFDIEKSNEVFCVRDTPLKTTLLLKLSMVLLQMIHFLLSPGSFLDIRCNFRRGYVKKGLQKAGRSVGVLIPFLEVPSWRHPGKKKQKKILKRSFFVEAFSIIGHITSIWFMAQKFLSQKIRY